MNCNPPLPRRVRSLGELSGRKHQIASEGEGQKSWIWAMSNYKRDSTGSTDVEHYRGCSAFVIKLKCGNELDGNNIFIKSDFASCKTTTVPELWFGSGLGNLIGSFSDKHGKSSNELHKPANFRRNPSFLKWGNSSHSLTTDFLLYDWKISIGLGITSFWISPDSSHN